MKSNDSKKELEPKFRVVRVKDRFVDLGKFEIKTHEKKEIYRVLRIENEEANKR